VWILACLGESAFGYVLEVLVAAVYHSLRLR